MSDAAGGSALLPYVYHERQEPGSMLCAQHALNGVLQDGLFDATHLGQLAQEIAAYEHEELGLGGSEPLESTLARHMDDTGYFSVEVIDRACKSWDLRLERWRNQGGLQTRHAFPEREFAFLLHLGSHWFTLRGFGRDTRQWYNLNSFFAKPQWLSATYLSTFLDTVEREGYTVFVVEHDGDTSPLQSIADEIALSKGGRGTQDAPIHVLDDDDADLQVALQVSMEDQQQASSAPEVALPSGYRSRRRRQSLIEEMPAADMNGRAVWKTRRKQASPSSASNDALQDMMTQRSPFLHSRASTLLDSDVESIEEFSDNEPPQPQRTHVDDEEEQLRAVIAASLGQPYKVPEHILTQTERKSQRSPSPPIAVPADVERIRKLRAEAISGEQSPAPVPAAEQASSGDEAEEEGKDMSPDEIRRRRLARFG
ncbi:hypothetical protein MVES1_002034 [Malassezia vespertilionis]|nr:uncharacterized protein MVES1_002034 [Malassezia vespertilionis]WFD06680.1 hypothetical protein MVES1_002034 [Malassezia vespertilionis]